MIVMSLVRTAAMMIGTFVRLDLLDLGEGVGGIGGNVGNFLRGIHFLPRTFWPERGSRGSRLPRTSAPTTSQRRTHGCLAILAVDLDDFKFVNDTYGLAAGDQVPKIAAQRILSSLRGSDVAARLGGHEFAVLLIGDLDTARIVADKLVEVLSAPYPNVPPAVSASIGIAVYPQSGKDASMLLGRADAALYAAKMAGKRRVAIDTVAAPP